MLNNILKRRKTSIRCLNQIYRVIIVKSKYQQYFFK